MNTRLIVSAALGAVLLSASAFAADAPVTSAKACLALEKQFTHVEPNHIGAGTKDEMGRTVGKEAMALCKAGKSDEGVKKFHEEMRLWGDKPAA
ncbi:MAG: hypothetical protein O3A88_03340 [Proteobacteria bacterium]|nr:hypothetical protein [Pseudomonadota bacterium]